MPGGTVSGASAFSTAAATLPRSLPWRLAVTETVPGHIVAVVLSNDGAGGDFGDVAQRTGGGAPFGRDRQIAQILRAFHQALRNLDLEAETDAGFGSA